MAWLTLAVGMSETLLTCRMPMRIAINTPGLDKFSGSHDRPVTNSEQLGAWKVSVHVGNPNSDKHRLLEVSKEA